MKQVILHSFWLFLISCCYLTYSQAAFKRFPREVTQLLRRIKNIQNQQQLFDAEDLVERLSRLALKDFHSQPDKRKDRNIPVYYDKHVRKFHTSAIQQFCKTEPLSEDLTYFLMQLPAFAFLNDTIMYDAPSDDKKKDEQTQADPERNKKKKDDDDNSSND